MVLRGTETPQITDMLKQKLDWVSKGVKQNVFLNDVPNFAVLLDFVNKPNIVKFQNTKQLTRNPVKTNYSTNTSIHVFAYKSFPYSMVSLQKQHISTIPGKSYT